MRLSCVSAGGGEDTCHAGTQKRNKKLSGERQVLKLRYELQTNADGIRNRYIKNSNNLL
jgi:hypothetical protein